MAMIARGFRNATASNAPDVYKVRHSIMISDKVVMSGYIVKEQGSVIFTRNGWAIEDESILTTEETLALVEILRTLEK
jgi:hypothetical protein